MNDRLAEQGPVSQPVPSEPIVDRNFGIESHSAARIRRLCDTTAGLRALHIFGSRARGDHRARSDIDFEADAPDWSAREHLAFTDALKQLPIVYPVDCVWRQSSLPDELRDALRVIARRSGCRIGRLPRSPLWRAASNSSASRPMC